MSVVGVGLAGPAAGEAEALAGTAWLSDMSFQLFLLWFAAVGISALGYYSLISRRYGIRSVAIAVGMVTVFSVGIASVISIVVKPVSDSSVQWHQIMSLDKVPVALEYKADQGLFLITLSDKTKLTDVVPACLLDGPIAKWNSSSTKFSEPTLVKVGGSPLLELPPPPREPTRQITLTIEYPVETDAIGGVSYAAYSNGEIWCVENVLRGGSSGFVGEAFAGMISLTMSAISFCGSYVLLGTAVVAFLEIRRWYSTKVTE